MKQMTSNDYAKELHKLELKTIALEKRIKTRAEELMKANPDVMIQLPFFIHPYKAGDIFFQEKPTIDSVLLIIKTIEIDLANKNEDF
jgi:hypothetical protein